MTEFAGTTLPAHRAQADEAEAGLASRSGRPSGNWKNTCCAGGNTAAEDVARWKA